jgi:hypothetical protein
LICQRQRKSGGEDYAAFIALDDAVHACWDAAYTRLIDFRLAIYEGFIKI